MRLREGRESEENKEIKNGVRKGKESDRNSEFVSK